MSGRIHKSQIPIRRQADLAPEIREEIANAKNAIKADITLRFFGNRSGFGPGDGPPLPGVSHGCRYVEFQVGEAHPGDSKSKGSRRLVFELHEASGRILEIYYTEKHYAKFTFVRLV